MRNTIFASLYILHKHKMKRFGLIGCPISHSLSPALFKAAYRDKYGSSYVYDLIEGEDFGKAFGTFMESYDGINVTAPFKEKAFGRADSAEKECKAIGAANLLVKTDSGIAAYNTDCMGVRMSLEKAIERKRARKAGADGKGGPDGTLKTGIYSTEGLEALVVGCGGAGKAAAAAAAAMGMKTTILNRTASRAEDFAAGFPGCPFNVGSLDEFTEYFRRSDAVIYTLPSGIPQIETLSEDDFRMEGKTILEANYRNPCFPDILGRIFPMYKVHQSGSCRANCLEISDQETGHAGPIYVPGQQWLLYQAVAGYVIFTGEEPDEKAMMKVL